MSEFLVRTVVNAPDFETARRLVIRSTHEGDVEVVIARGCPDHRIKSPEPSAPHPLKPSFCRTCGETSMSSNPMRGYRAERVDDVRIVGAHRFADAVASAKESLGESVEVKLIGKCPGAQYPEVEGSCGSEALAEMMRTCTICGQIH